MTAKKGKGPGQRAPLTPMFMGVRVTLSVNEAAQALGCARSTLYKMKLPVTRATGRPRFFAEDINLRLLLTTETP